MTLLSLKINENALKALSAGSRHLSLVLATTIALTGIMNSGMNIDLDLQVGGQQVTYNIVDTTINAHAFGPGDGSGAGGGDTGSGCGCGGDSGGDAGPGPGGSGDAGVNAGSDIMDSDHTALLVNDGDDLTELVQHITVKDHASMQRAIAKGLPLGEANIDPKTPATDRIYFKGSYATISTNSLHYMVEQAKAYTGAGASDSFSAEAKIAMDDFTKLKGLEGDKVTHEAVSKTYLVREFEKSNGSKVLLRILKSDKQDTSQYDYGHRSKIDMRSTYDSENGDMKRNDRVIFKGNTGFKSIR